MSFTLRGDEEGLLRARIGSRERGGPFISPAPRLYCLRSISFGKLEYTDESDDEGLRGGAPLLRRVPRADDPDWFAKETLLDVQGV